MNALLLRKQNSSPSGWLYDWNSVQCLIPFSGCSIVWFHTHSDVRGVDIWPALQTAYVVRLHSAVNWVSVLWRGELGQSFQRRCYLRLRRIMQRAERLASPGPVRPGGGSARLGGRGEVSSLGRDHPTALPIRHCHEPRRSRQRLFV